MLYTRMILGIYSAAQRILGVDRAMNTYGYIQVCLAVGNSIRVERHNIPKSMTKGDTQEKKKLPQKIL